MEGEVNSISEAEVKKALKKMKNGKGVGPGQIPAEAGKSLGEEAIWLLKEFPNTVMEKDTIPNEWKDRTTVPFYKEKGDVQNCANHGGIKLASHTIKLLDRVRIKRLRRGRRLVANSLGL